MRIELLGRRIVLIVNDIVQNQKITNIDFVKKYQLYNPILDNTALDFVKNCQ